MAKRPRGEQPPYIRYVVFGADGTPTGWCMGISPESAKQIWTSHPNEKITQAEAIKRWEWHASKGYTIRRVELRELPQDTPDAPA